MSPEQFRARMRELASGADGRAPDDLAQLTCEVLSRLLQLAAPSSAGRATTQQVAAALVQQESAMALEATDHALP